VGVRVAHLFRFLFCPIMCHHDITEVLLKMALNTITPILGAITSNSYCLIEVVTNAGLTVLPIVCRRAYVLFTLFVLVCV